MAAPKALRDRIKVGDVFDVTNHYIKREDHPSYGTTRRTITATNTAAFYMALEGRKANRQEWPRVDRFTRPLCLGPSLCIRLYMFHRIEVER